MKAEATVVVDGAITARAGLYDDDRFGGVCVELTDLTGSGARLVIAGSRDDLRRALRATTDALAAFLAEEERR